ncbi:hypothetical protein F4813DRAFT_389798 [Daldinia decipiens]|uniref:uncharacterized protein n=1 Tax=Daldinia decipiens TaxID=326647 RepID=UPI0020C4891F|nr:uncharacterized protein F4813DRAFT_389798 [Daldinia decipiens]KAI1657214.1 hypothetical protein F4813DRAFT_389798 [Daldinia decipiens]
MTKNSGGSKKSSSLRVNLESELALDSEFGLPEGSTVRVMTALGIARDCTDALNNPKLATILGKALNGIWLKLLTRRGYVMTRNEFAVFNFFQDLDLDGAMSLIAINARALYWDKTHGDR